MSDRLPVIVRPARSDDIRAIIEFDSSYTTDYVWQMEFREDEGALTSVFRKVRLPRSMRVMYPRDTAGMADHWTKRRLFMVAEVTSQVRGYLSLIEGTVSDTAWVAEFAVERRVRRQGLGTALITSAVDWARRADKRRLIIEVQSKNYPAICFCEKHGFTFCGYSDRYFANQDIALFFGMSF